MREILNDIFTWPWFSEPHGYNFNGHLIRHPEGNLCIDPVEPGEEGLPPGAVVFLHGLFSLGLGLYDHVPSLDIVMHLAGGVTIAYSFGVLVDLLEAQRLIGFGHELVRAFVIASLVTSAATGWEFVEFLCDRFAGTRAQLGLQDTLGDILVGILGGLAFLALVYGRKPGRSNPP